MKVFVIFGLLCFSDPDTIMGINCINFWEPANKEYKTREACVKQSNIVGDMVMKDMQDGRIPVTELTIWCIEKDSTKGDPA